MRKMIQGRLSVFKFESFKKFKNITHFITTKEGWISGVPRFTGDSEDVYDKFRKELAQSCEVDEKKFIFPRQIHSDHVAVVNSAMKVNTIDDTDALITSEPGLFICVQSADCVPILLFDPVKKVVAAVHAGWKGTITGIAGKTVRKMEETFGCNPADILAGIGPSIHIHAFEVGPEVVEAAKKCFKNVQVLLKPSLKAGHAYFDLWEANRTVLTEAGITDANIEIMGLCSFEHADLFFSARREGPETGRMVSAIKLL